MAPADVAAAVIEVLAGSDVVLVLDNCEHVLVAVAEMTEQITRRCPAVVVLATSRQALDVPTRTYAAWKLSVNRSVLLELDAYTDHERWLELDLGVFHSEDLMEGVRAFAEKRPPHFTGQ